MPPEYRNLRNYLVNEGYIKHISSYSDTVILNNVPEEISIFIFSKIDRLLLSPISWGNYQLKPKVSDVLIQKLKDIEIFYDLSSDYLENKFFDDWGTSFKDYPVQEPYTITWFDVHCQRDWAHRPFSSSGKYVRLHEICDIHYGIASGCDSRFKLVTDDIPSELEKFAIKLVYGKSISAYFIDDAEALICFGNSDAIPDELVSVFPDFLKYLEYFKDWDGSIPSLSSLNDFLHWGYLGNYDLLSSNVPRLFVRINIDVSKNNYIDFAFGDSSFLPGEDVLSLFLKKGTAESIYYILGFLNSAQVQRWIIKNIPLSNNSVDFYPRLLGQIPYHQIDFSDPGEVRIYENIVELVKLSIKEKTDAYRHLIQREFNFLYYPFDHDNENLMPKLTS